MEQVKAWITGQDSLGCIKEEYVNKREPELYENETNSIQVKEELSDPEIYDNSTVASKYVFLEEKESVKEEPTIKEEPLDEKDMDMSRRLTPMESRRKRKSPVDGNEPEGKLPCHLFYSRKRNKKVLVPVDPELSEDDLFNEDDGEDPDYVPLQFDPNIPGPSNKPPTKRRRTATAFGDADDDEDEEDEDEDEEEEEEEEEQQQLKSKKGKGSAKKRKNEFQTRPTTWKKQDMNNPPMPKYKHQPPQFVESSYHYFARFFTPDLIKHITYQTNLYATQRDIATTFKTDENEILSFVAILLFMGVCNLPSLDDYWALSTRIPQVADLMSSKRFRLLRRTLHFNDNSQIHGSVDKFYKVRPLFTSITKTFLQEPQTPKQSIDEVMVGYKGKTAGNLRQYIKNKPHKWGFKLFSRASEDGFIHDMILYQGEPTLVAHGVPLSPVQETLGITSKIVSVLASTMTSTSNTAIFADNYFTSLELIRYLQTKDCRYTGTARDNRIGNPPLKDVKEMMKTSVPRGSYSYMTTDDGIMALRWKDTKVVTVLSTDLGVEPVSKCLRYSKASKKKEEVECPNVIKYYNANMGGIDKSDMLVQLYRTPMKSKKWYMRLFAYCLDLAVCNAWLCYRRDCESLGETKTLSLKNFRLELFQFASSRKPNIHRRRGPSAGSVGSSPDEGHSRIPDRPTNIRGHRSHVPSPTVRFDTSLVHIPVIQGRQTCKHCSKRENHPLQLSLPGLQGAPLPQHV